MGNTTTEISSKDFADMVAAYIASPKNWPAAMAARTLRLAAGHPAYSPTNQALIMDQLLARFDGVDFDESIDRALSALQSEIAPRTVWAKRGYQVAGPALFIWSKPVPLWLDSNGNRVKPNTEGAIKRTVFRGERTYLAADVRDAEGATAEVATGAPALSEGEARDVFERLAAWITGQGWKVTRTARDMREGGWTRHGIKTIAVHGGLDGWAAVETLAHEIAHAILHGDNDERDYSEHRGAIEAEAESVAFGVMMLAGQTELAKGSVKYATDWAKRDQKLLAISYERACYVTDALARVMLGEVDVQIQQSAKAEKLQAKAGNKELAAQLRAAGIEPKGEAWKLAKAGAPIESLTEYVKAA